MTGAILVQQRDVAGHRAWRTRWSFGYLHLTRALIHYRGLNAFDGWAKRLVMVHPDGSREVLHRHAE